MKMPPSAEEWMGATPVFYTYLYNEYTCPAAKHKRT